MANYGMGHDDNRPMANPDRDFDRSQIAMKTEATPRGTGHALECIDDNLNRLEEALGRLISRLDPMLKPNHQERPGDPDSMPDVSGVGQRIYRQAERLNQMVYAVNVLVERVDL